MFRLMTTQFSRSPQQKRGSLGVSGLEECHQTMAAWGGVSTKFVIVVMSMKLVGTLKLQGEGEKESVL